MLSLLLQYVWQTLPVLHTRYQDLWRLQLENMIGNTLVRNSSQTDMLALVMDENQSDIPYPGYQDSEKVLYDLTLIVGELTGARICLKGVGLKQVHFTRGYPRKLHPGLRCM